MTFIQPRTLDLLPHPFFIGTEGMGDARFVDELLEFKGITNCSVGCPSRESTKNKTGKDAFPDYFATIQVARARVKSAALKGLLVVADADTNPNNAFTAITAALTDAKFPVPSRPFAVEEANNFRTAVYLLPGPAKTGTLEHMLLDATFTKSPNLKKCLDDFSACTGALRSARQNKEAKMRMSALAAAFCEDDPWTSAHTLWSSKYNPVPINSARFDDLAQFLTRFSEP